MKNVVLPAFRLLIALTVLTGVIYPLAVTAVAQAFFPRQAGGSLIERAGRVVGSELVSQKFVSDRYFHSRPSAIDHNPLPSGGSNLGPTSKALKDRVDADRGRLGDGAPQDLMFTSASGLDPHLSPAGAFYQVERVAASRGLSAARVHDLVTEHIEGLSFGLLGEPRVNALVLNLALDRLAGEGP